MDTSQLVELFYEIRGHLGVSPNFEITVACGLKCHWYFRTLSFKFQNVGTKIEVFLNVSKSQKHFFLETPLPKKQTKY